MAKMVRYGIYCPNILGWLFNEDAGVWESVTAFGEDRGPNQITVAIPPSDLDRYRAKRAGKEFSLPTIRVDLRKTKHPQTGALVIQAHASDADLALLQEWRGRSLQTGLMKRSVA